MVLQRSSTVKVWGTAESNQQLNVKFNEQIAKVTANAKGDWFTTIKTPDSGGPFELEVAAVEGEPKVIFSDIMVGEVWLCSGGLNMRADVTNVLNSENEIELSKNFQQIRLFRVESNPSSQPLDDFSKVVPWSVCSPDSVKNFSATAYFFGRELSKELEGVPIGLIDASCAGSTCEAWCERAAMDGVESLGPMLNHWDDNDELTNPNRPGNLFNGMIAPLTGFPIRGVVWYQGESNNGRGAQYRVLLPTLISNWRSAFMNKEMRFYFVQPAPFRYQSLSPEGLPEIWDSQLRTVKEVANTGMVVTTDIGALEELQPKNKQEVGRRLSLIALADVYRDQLSKDRAEIEPSGPLFDSMSPTENGVRIAFKHVAGGLKIREGDDELTGFTICGSDEKFVPASAVIVGDTIEVSSPDVANPVAVRFGWQDSNQPNLTNTEGLPASPFRTDDFTLQSSGQDF